MAFLETSGGNGLLGGAIDWLFKMASNKTFYSWISWIHTTHAGCYVVLLYMWQHFANGKKTLVRQLKDKQQTQKQKNQ